MRETRLRSLVKTILYRTITVICIDFPVVYLGLLLLGKQYNPKFAISLSFTFEILHSLAYYSYERFWNRIKWGISKK